MEDYPAQALEDLRIYANGGLNKLLDGSHGFEDMPDRIRAMYAYSWSMVIDHLQATTEWTSMEDPATRIDEIITNLCAVFGEAGDKRLAFDLAMLGEAQRGVHENMFTAIVFSPDLPDAEYDDQKLLERLSDLVNGLVADPVEARETTLRIMTILPYAYVGQMLWRDELPIFDPRPLINLVRSIIAGDRPFNHGG